LFLSSRKYDPWFSGYSSPPRILITVYPSRIPDSGVKKAPDPGSGIGSATQLTGTGSINNNKRGGLKKKFVVLPVFVAINITKYKFFFIVELVKKKMWANLQRIIALYAQKIFTKLSKL
jgi:hypothetical protein